MKNLVYVDAENISKEDFVRVISKTQQMVCMSSVTGKFYGNRDVIGEMLSIGYNGGFEFIETSSIVRSRKNVTDMKITVDCITDVMDWIAQGLSVSDLTVYLVSGDCDFVPLIYKLRGLGLQVELPISISGLEEKTLADLEAALKQAQYDPRLRQDILQAQYPAVRKLLPEEQFSDDLLQEWFARKKRKFLKDATLLLGDGAAALADLAPEEFGFIRIMQILGIDKGSDVCEALLASYTQKCFGFNFPVKTRELVLNGI